jgi:hypothetical protein
MKKMCPSLFLKPVGMGVSISRARSGVRQFLSIVFTSNTVYIAVTLVLSDQSIYGIRSIKENKFTFL